MLGEVRNFVSEGDECRVKFVKADHRNGKTVADLEHTVVVGNEASFPVSLDADHVWQTVDEIFANFAKRATHDVEGRLADVEFNDVGPFTERDHLFEIRGTKTGI